MIVQVLVSDVNLGVWVKLQFFRFIPINDSKQFSLAYSRLSLI